MGKVRSVFSVLLLCGVIFASAEADMSVSVSRPFCNDVDDTVSVELVLENLTPATATAAFDLLVTFDSSLAFQSAELGDLPVFCEWEYFTHRLEGQYRVRLVAMADIVNGAAHPSCYCDSSGVLANLAFTISQEPSQGYEFLRIGWIWFDCGDNVFSSINGDSLFISREVYDFDGHTETAITNDSASFPTPGGAPDVCLPNPRRIDYYNGGIHVITEDTVPPTAFCPGDTTVGTDSGYCTAKVYYSAEVADNYPGSSIQCLPPPGWRFSRGSTQVICIATDFFGNEDTCSFDILVVDDEPPVPICPGDTAVSNDSGTCSAEIAFSAYVVDNCPGAVIFSDYPSPSAFPVGSTAVACTAFDIAGNSAACEFMVSVSDAEPPDLDLPEDITVPADPDSCGAIVLYDAVAVDNCSEATVTCDPVSGSFFEIGSDSVTCTGIDGYGNAAIGGFTVTVVDTQPPVMDMPEGLTAVADPGECGADATYHVSAVDDCGEASVACEPASGSYFSVGISAVACIAIDNAGNADTSEFSLTVIDSQPPVILPHNDTMTVNDPGVCGAVVDYEVLAADNCTEVTVECSPSSGSVFPAGATSARCIAADGAGLTDTIAFDITVVDTARPILGCPEDMVVMNDSGYYGAVVEFTPVADDNCPEITVHAAPPSGAYFEHGTTPVDVTATDAAGNSNACRFSVTVELNDPDGDGIPVWDDNCPDDANPLQVDSDGDGIGDICDWRYGDVNRDEVINVSDAVYIIAYIFKGGPAPDPLASGDVDCTGSVNIADAVFVINYIFTGGPEPSCP